MSVYLPINGLAGAISFTLYLRSDNSIIVTTTTVNVFEFKEANQESQDNEIFENILGDLIKNFYGFRKVISFSLANSASLGMDNLSRVLLLVDCINMINNNPELYKLSITFRQGSTVSAFIEDAVFAGELNINEISQSSNSGQVIPLEFRSRVLVQNVTFGHDDPQSLVYAYLLAEDGSRLLLESGGKILLEVNGVTNA